MAKSKGNRWIYAAIGLVVVVVAIVSIGLSNNFFGLYTQANNSNEAIRVRSMGAVLDPVTFSIYSGSNFSSPATEGNISCAESICGIRAGEDSHFNATIERGEKTDESVVRVSFTSPLDHGPFIKNHQYVIRLGDFVWNHNDSLPTEEPDFTNAEGPIRVDNISLPNSNITGPYYLEYVFGRSRIFDITEGNNTLVAKNIFSHALVAYPVNETFGPSVAYFIAVNIPPGVSIGDLENITAEQAQALAPYHDGPGFTYPMQIPLPANFTGVASHPNQWPVVNSEEPMLFTFLTYKNTSIRVINITAQN